MAKPPKRETPRTEEAGALTLMGLVTLVLGGFLTLLGPYFFLTTYWDSGEWHPTALIPAGFGVVFLLLGWLSQNQKRRMHVMHGAALLGLVGVAVTGPDALTGMGNYFAGAEVFRPAAVLEKFLMATACLAYLIFCVNSFIEARKERLEQQERDEREAKEKARFRRR